MVCVVGAFERIGDGNGQNAALRGSARRFNQARQGFGRQAAAGGIVNQDVVGSVGQAAFQQGGNAVADGFGAGCAAAVQHGQFFIVAGRLKTGVVGRQYHCRAVYQGMVEEDVQSVLQNGFAADFDILFGFARAETRADSGGGNQGDVAAFHACSVFSAVQRHCPPDALSSSARYSRWAAVSSASARRIFKPPPAV